VCGGRGGNDTGQIKLWDTSHGGLLTTMNGMESIIDFVWDGNTLISGNRKGYCQVWDLKTGDMIR